MLNYIKNKIFSFSTVGTLESTNTAPTVSVEDLDPFVQALSQMPNANNSFFDGDKFFGGFGDTQIYLTDYWTLRQRSNQLFNDNLYARGLIRRLVTNEINVGLNLEATPNGKLIGLSDDEVTEWSEDVESRYKIWGDNPLISDYKQASTNGKLQQNCRLEAIVEGDCLVTLRFSRKNNLPQVELTSGGLVQTPIGITPRKGNTIVHGVELDSRGRHVAFYVRQKDSTSKRVPAFGERSGRKIAWLVYGTDKRLDAVRGQPLLSLMLQSLKEIDGMRDSVQRKAFVNSLIAVFVKKTQDKIGTRPLAQGATRRDAANITDGDGKTRTLNIQKMLPGTAIDELQMGEEPVVHSTAGTDINFGAFEASILNAVAWSQEIPPGILMLSFHSNYSASRGEVNEFKMYLNKSNMLRADEFDKPIYIEWLLNEVMLGKIKANGLAEAWLNPNSYDILGAWTQSDWAGSIKPNVDLKKEVAGYKAMNEEGWVTNDRATRDLNGSKWSKNIVRIRKENELKAKALRPLLDLEKEFPESKILAAVTAENGITVEAIADKMQEAIEDNG